MSIKVFNKNTGKYEIIASNKARDIQVADLKGNFKSDNLEGALEELNEKASATPSDIDQRVTTIENMIANGELGGGGGATFLPTIKSSLEISVIDSDKELSIPIYFTSPNLGTGVGYVVINGIETSVVTVKQGNNTVKVGLLPEGNNTIAFYVKDRAGILSNQLEWNIVCGGLKVSTTFDYNADYSIEDKIRMPFKVETISEDPIIMHMTIDGNTEELSCNTGYNEYLFNIKTIGVHSVSFYLTSGVYRSKTISFNLVIVNSSTLYVSTTFTEGEYKYGVPINFDYRISKDSSETFTVKLMIDGVISKTVQAPTGSYYWTISSLEVGSHTLRVEVSSDIGELEFIEVPISIYKSDYNIVERVSTGIVLELDATNRSNQDIDKNTWNDEEHGVTATLHNFNYTSNGWIDGQLVCDTDTYVEVDATPWKDNATLGSTIEIIYTPKNIGIEEARVLDYTSSNAPYNGIYIDTLKTSLSSTVNKGEVTLDDGEEIRVTYVIDRENKFAKIYVDGCVCRALYLTDSGSGVNKVYEDFSHNDKIYLNSQKGTSNSGACSIKLLRVYNRALSDEEVIQNYIASFTNIDEQEKIYNFCNDISGMPALYFYGDTTNMTGDNAVNLRVKYVSPNAELYGDSFDFKSCPVKWQGTSSLQYNLKNYTMYLKDDDGVDYYYSPFKDGVKEHIFTFKTNYMESSNCHNLGLARFANDCIFTTKNDAQLLDPNVRNAINGFPVILYINGVMTDIGCFNLDRHSTNSLGLDTSKFPNCLSYEINANSDITAGAFNKWTSATGITEEQYYKNDFSARYPLSRANGIDTFDELKRLVNWVSDASDDLFKEQIDQYFNKEYLIRYYLLVMVFQLVDSLGKNLMLNTWDGSVWYLGCYDLDTGLGLDNTGYLKYDTDCEIESGYWNTSNSQLWTKVQRVFEEDIKAEYAKLRQDKFTLDNIMKYLYDEVGSKISPVLYNFSMNARYLQYGAQYVYACHGNRKHQIRRWVRERLLFCDTLFDYAPTTTSKSITLRCNRLGDVSLDIDTYQPMYVQVKWRNGTIQKLKVNRGQTTTFTGYLATATDQEVLIYSAPYLKSIGDISYLNPNSIDIGNANRLTYLKCNCEALLKADVSANPYLRYIDLTDCPKLGTAVGSNVLNVSGCDNLKDLYIRGTALTSIQANIEGGNIQNIVFPTTVQSIDLRNMYVLKSLDIPLNSNLNSLTLINCPNLETLRGDSSLNDLEIYQTIQTINFQNSLNIENFEIIPYNLISLALRNMPATKYITIKNDDNNSLTNTTLNTCVIDECENLVSFKIGTNITLVNNRTIDLSSAEGLEEVICTGNITGLDTIYIPTSVKKLIFTGTTNSIKNILVASNPDRPQGFTGIDLTGCNNIEEFDMIALTNVKNVIGLNLTFTKNPNFNTRRTTENYIEPEGTLDLTNYEGIEMSNLFKGIDFNKLIVTLPENLSDVIDASSMFRKCTFSTVINPDSIISKMSSVQNASYMFADCEFTEDIRPTLVLSNLPQLTDASYMFANCTGLVNFNDIEIADTINTANMFQGIEVEEIGTLTMSHFPFTVTSKITTIGNITLTQATSVADLFKNNKVLTTVGNINLPLVNNASHMFDGCSKLSSIGTVTIPNATDLSYMYNNCIKLTTYNDISNYPEITNISYMYSNTKISVIGDLELSDDIITTNVFGGVGISEAGNINTGNLLFDLNYLTRIGNLSIRNITNANNLFKDNKSLISVGNINMPLVTNASHMFDGCNNLSSIGTFNMPVVEDLSYAFAGTNIGVVNISSCTSLTNASYMYKGNTGITELGVLSFKENLIVKGLFEECTNLSSVESLTLTGTTDSSYLFNGCSKLTSIGSLSLEDITTANYMFKGCSKLNISNINLPKLVYASHMFEDCSLLESNPLTAPLLQNASYMFCNCIAFTSAFDVQEVFPSIVDASYIFKGCINITSIGDFALSDSVISTGMFEGTSITVVGNVTASSFPFDGSKLVSVGNITLSCDNTEDLFKDNTSLTTVGDLVLNNVTNTSHMFDGCSNLSSIGTLTAPLLENASYMFRNCVLLTSMVDFSNYPLLTNIDYMYAGCTGLPKEIETLELSDTVVSSTGLLDNVGITSIGTMNIPTIACSLNSIESIDSLTVRNTEDARALFKDNTSLTSINSVNLPSATNIAGLFKGCTNITTIGSVNAPNATIAYESNIGGLFDECTSLSSTPDISELPNITIGDYMFNGCSMLTNIDTSVFEQLSSVDNMFNGCTELTTLGDLDLSDVESVSTMFNGCENISTVGNVIAPEFMMPTTNLTTIGDLTLTNSSNIELFKDAINLTTIGNINLPNCLDSNGMFSGCVRLVNIGEINAPKCTNISNMFKGCTSLVNAPNTDKCSKVTNASGLYSGCTKLRNMQNLVFPEIINSTGILQGCTITSLNDIDLNDIDFNTKNCTTLGNVTLRGATSAREKFRNNFKLTAIGDVSIPNAEDVSYMFADCTVLVNVGTINIPNLSNASYMFSGCTSMTSMIDLSGFASLRNASYMFRGCTGLPSTLGDIILPEVENVTGMFENVTITAVGNIDLIELPFNTTSLTSIGNMKLTTTNAFKMFYNVTSLTSIGDITLPNVVNASYMFSGCTNLESIGNITMNSATNCSYMFNNCSKLASTINLTSFPVIENTSYMFNGCTSLPTVFGDIILPNVSNYENMFGGIKFTEVGNIDLPTMILDLTNITKLGNVTLRKQTSARAMFFNNQKLLEIGDIYLPMATDVGGMFGNCTNMTKCGKLTAPEATNGFYYTSTAVNNFKFFGIFTLCSSLTEIRFPLLKGDKSANDNELDTNYSNWHSDGCNMFQNCINLSSIIFDEDVIPLYSMRYMFSGCSSLKTIKLPNTSNVLRMTGIFYGCTSLTSVIITSLDNVIDITNMFKDCTSLTTVNIPTECANIENASSAFYNCTSLEKIVLPKMESLTDGSYMFSGCSKLKSVKTIESNNKIVSDINIPSLYTCTNVSYMFENCTTLTSIYIGESTNLTNVNYMFNGCTGLADIKHLELPDAITSASNIFTGVTNVTNIDYYKAYDLFSLDISKVQTIGTLSLSRTFASNGSGIFKNNTNLISIDKLVLPNSTYLVSAFSGCANLQYVNKIIAPKLSDLGDTGNYSSLQTSTSYLSTGAFYNCTSLETTPDMSECPNVKYANFAFYGCSSLNNINLKLPNLIYTIQMFQGCTSLTNIEYLELGLVSYFVGIYEGITNAIDIDEIVVRNVNSIPPTTTTINKINMIGCRQLNHLTNLTSVNEYKTDVTDLSGSFTGSSSITHVGKITAPNATSVCNSSASSPYTTSIFYNCVNLEEQPEFDCPKLTDLTGLFYKCEKLELIDLSLFENITKLSGTFGYCTGLLETPKLPNDCSNITDINELFYNCITLTEIDLSSYDLSKVINIGSLFGNCSNLTLFKLPDNIGKLINIAGMFKGCSKLQGIIDLSKHDLSDLIYIYSAFEGCANITNVIFDNDLILNNVTSIHNMFKDCTNLTSISLPDFPSATGISKIFDGCINLQELKRFIVPQKISSSYNAYAFNNCTSLTKLGYIDIYNKYSCSIFTNNITDIEYLKINDSSTSFYDLGYYCRSIKNIGTLELPNVTELYSVFSGCTELISVDKIIAPKATTAWNNESGTNNIKSLFYNRTKLTKVTDLSECPLLTNIGFIYSGCTSLESADLTEKLPNITFEDASYMFYGCTNLSNIAFPDGIKIKYPYYMVGNCTSLTSIDLSNISVDNCSSLFRGCTNLKTITLPDISLSTSLNYTFYNCSSLVSIDLPDLLKVTDTNLAFSGCTSLKKISKINMPAVTTSIDMFNGCTALEEISEYVLGDYSNTGLVTQNDIVKKWTLTNESITGFRNDTALSTISNVYMPNATSIAGLFSGCTNLVSVDGIDAPIATTQYDDTNLGMFNGCSSLTTINNLNMPNVTDGSYMFKGCTSLTSAGIEQELTSIVGMFYRCSALTNITYLNIPNVTAIDNCILGCDVLDTIDNIIVNNDLSLNFIKNNPNITHIGYIKSINGDYDYATNKPFVNLISVGTIELPNNITFEGLFTDCIELETLDKIIAPIATDTFKLVSTFKYVPFRNTKISKLIDISECTNLVSLSGLYYQANITGDIDLTEYISSNIINISGLFSYCKSLTSITLPDDMSNIIDISNLVSISGIVELNIPAISSNATNISNVAYNCSNLTKITFNNDVLDKVTDARSLFMNCTSLTSVSVPELPNVIYALSMFNGCTNLQEIKKLSLPNFITSSDISSPVFNNCPLLTKLGYINISDLSNVQIPMSQITDIEYLKINNATAFDNLKGSTNIKNIGTLELPNVTHMMNSFSNCTNLVSINKIIAPNVSTLFECFSNCSNINNVDMSEWELLDPVSISSVFKNCTSLTNFELPNNINNESAGYFEGCTSLVTVDLTKYTFTNNCIQNIYSTFKNCTSLTTAKLPILITRNSNASQTAIDTFLNANKLENLTVEQLPLVDLTDWQLNSKVLTNESIDSIVNALQDNSSNTKHTYVIKLANEVVAKVTMEQAKIITDKNWKLINLDGSEWKDVYANSSPTAVNPVSNLSVVNASSTGESVKISWTDPDDITDDNGITTAKWAGTKIVRKVGSYPDYVTDGVLVCDSTTKNQYSITGYKDNGLTLGETYYYKAFPYTVAGVYNYNEANNISITTQAKYSEYGVRWDKSSNPTLTRLGDAVGLVANVGVDSTVVQNDFDNIYPWSERKQCNLSVDGEVLAYKGDPDFATDGSNGMVMVETPIFYQKYVETDDYIEYWISDGPTEGYRLNPRFIKKDGTILDKIYTGAYEAVQGSSSTVLASKAGSSPKVNITLPNARTYARKIGTGWGLIDIAYRSDILFYLFTIEFATLNSQSIMMGPVNNSAALSTGLTNSIVASSGSVTSNTTGKTSFIYRGEENIWGDVYEWVDGCNIQNGAIYVCTNPEDYASDIFTDPYVKVGYNYMNGSTDTSGYISKMGYDSNYPYCNLPYSYSGSTSTYYCDYCYLYSGNKVLCVGGYWSIGSGAGLSCWNACYSSSTSSSGIGCRLSYKPS